MASSQNPFSDLNSHEGQWRGSLNRQYIGSFSVIYQFSRTSGKGLKENVFVRALLSLSFYTFICIPMKVIPEFNYFLFPFCFVLFHRGFFKMFTFGRYDYVIGLYFHG